MTRKIRYAHETIGKLLISAIVLISTIVIQVGEQGQARVLEDLSARFVIHAGAFSPITLGKPLAFAPLPIPELLATSLIPPSRPTKDPHKITVPETIDSDAKRRLGLALLFLGMIAEEQ